MGQTLARTPYGFFSLEDDGTGLFLPPDLLPPDAPLVGGGQLTRGAGGPVPDAAFEGAGLPGGSPVPDGPYPGPPSISGAPGDAGAGAPSPPVATQGVGQSAAGGGAPISLPDEPDPAGGEQPGEPPDAISGVDGGDTTPATPPPAPPPVDPNAISSDPFVAESQLIGRQPGIIDAAAARDQQIAAERDAAMNAAKAQAVKDRQRWAQKQAESAEAFSRAAHAQNDEAKRKPETSFGGTVKNLIAVFFGAVGQGLAGQNPADNPVLKILERKAQEEAAARTERWTKLKAGVDNAREGFDQVGAMAKTAAEYNAAQLGAIKLDYAAQLEASAKIATNEQAKNAALIAAQKARQEAVKHYEDAGGEAADRHRADLIAIDEANKRAADIVKGKADTAQGWYTAKTGRINADETIRHDKEMEAKSKEDSAAAERLALKAWEDTRAQQGGVMPYVERKLNPDGSYTYSPVKWVKPMNAPEPATDNQGRPVDADGNLTSVSGRPQATRAQEWRAPTTDEGKATRAALADAGFIASQARELADTIRKEGWTSDTLKSDAGRKLLQHYNEIMLTRKTNLDKLGVLTGPDVGIESGIILGTKGGDPTEWARMGDPAAAVDRMVQNLESRVDAQMRSQQYTGPKIKFSNITDATTADDLGVDAQRITKLGGNYTSDDLRGGPAGVDDPAKRPPPLPNRQADAVAASMFVASDDSKSGPAAKRAALDSLAVMAQDPNIGEAVMWMIATSPYGINLYGPTVQGTGAASQVPSPSAFTPDVQARIEQIRALPPEIRDFAAAQYGFDRINTEGGPITATTKLKAGKADATKPAPPDKVTGVPSTAAARRIAGKE